MIKTTKNIFEVLIVLFENKNLSINQIARKINISVMGVSKIVKKLEKENVVNVTKIGKSHIIKTNLIKTNLDIFSLAEKYKFEKFVDKHDSLKAFLIQLKNEIEDIADFSLIFGSYASGEASAKSDLDLMVVSSNKKVYKRINKIKSLLDIELYPLIVTKAEFIKQYKKKHRIYNEIINGKRVLINGEHNFLNLLLENE